MEEIMEKIKKFIEERNWDQFHSLDNLSKSIAIESAELLECFQWNSDKRGEQVEIFLGKSQELHKKLV